MTNETTSSPTASLAPCFPALPAGYTALAAWGFHDKLGFSYEFYRVYRPPKDHGERGEFSRLDEALSYWAVSFATVDPAGNEHIAGRWISLSAARKLHQPGLSFGRFSSPLAMSDLVPQMLRVCEISVEMPQPFAAVNSPRLRPPIAPPPTAGF